MTQAETVTVNRRALNNAGFNDALKAPGSHARIGCLQYGCPSGLNFAEDSDDKKPAEWVCDGEVPYDLVGGIHPVRRLVTPKQLPYFSDAAHERITYYWEVSFSGTIHLLPPRLMFVSGNQARVRCDISTEGLLRAYLSGFRSGMIERLQTR